jgi:hypothetical protein
MRYFVRENDPDAFVITNTSNTPKTVRIRASRSESGAWVVSRTNGREQYAAHGTTNSPDSTISHEAPARSCNDVLPQIAALTC